jgi:tRNA-2-methylthio-N6-dimethylallyladenosine synthase
MPDQVDHAVVTERYQRLVERVDAIAWQEAKKQVGRTVDVLVAEGEGRKDAATGRLSGRAPDNRLVHFAGGGNPSDGRAEPRPGDLATVTVTYAAPHHLVADGPALAVRRTPAGDAWERRVHGASSEQGDIGGNGIGGNASGACAAPAASGAVGLGLPAVGAPGVPVSG